MAQEDREVKKYMVYITSIFLILFIIYNVLSNLINSFIPQDLLYFFIIITIIPFVISLINYFKK